MFILENEYLLAWTVYGVSALGCLLVWLRMTRPLWRWLREPLRLLMAVVLLSPTLVDPERGLFAPAVAVMALDLLFQVGSSAWRAAADLASYGLIAFVLYLLMALIRWPIERHLKQRRADQGEDDPRTLRERMEPDHPPVRPSVSRNPPRPRLEPRL